MKNISILIKPASSLCDIDCKYCFYKDIACNREVYSQGLMKENVYKKLIDRAFEASDTTISFMFQGGEPLLWGLDNFKGFINYVNQKNKNNIRIYYSIQTNGINIDKETALFFKKNNFLVGISIDGNIAANDRFRVDLKGKGTYTRVMSGVELLNKFEVEFNILTVVNGYNSKKAKEVYDFFKSKNFRYMQFIPCMNPIDKMNIKFPFTLTKLDYSKFLKDLFDEWYIDFMNGSIYSIRTFENYISILMGMAPESCAMAGKCTIQFVIEADGSIYPCDFYVLDDYKLGNIFEDKLEIILYSKLAKKFISESLKLHPDCKKCKYFAICRNGCKRNREKEENGYAKDYYCETYIDFFDYTIERFFKIVDILKSRQY